MNDSNDNQPGSPTQPSPAGTERDISPQARRALAEAAARREKHGAKAKSTKNAKEVGGRKGPDPVRYGDWEKKGIASDF